MKSSETYLKQKYHPIEIEKMWWYESMIDLIDKIRQDDKTIWQNRLASFKKQKYERIRKVR